MIRVIIFVKEHQFFSILKLPFVRSIEMTHLSKQSKNEHCLYRVGVILKDLGHFKEQLKANIQPELLETISNKLHVQQILGVITESTQTSKIKSKNFKRLCEYSKMYNFHIPYKTKYLEQIEIIKALNVLKN